MVTEIKLANGLLKKLNNKNIKPEPIIKGTKETITTFTTIDMGVIIPK